MRPKDHLIKLHTKIYTKIKKSSLNKLKYGPKLTSLNCILVTHELHLI